MKAIIYREYGPPDVLRFEEMEKPAPGDNEVRIRVRAASVNPLDWHFMRGVPVLLRLITGAGKPKSPLMGRDLAGEVETVGKNVRQLKPGDAVYGGGRGAFAEFACAPESSTPSRKLCTFAVALYVSSISGIYPEDRARQIKRSPCASPSSLRAAIASPTPGYAGFP